jgi:hypothetical protein
VTRRGFLSQASRVLPLLLAAAAAPGFVRAQPAAAPAGPGYPDRLLWGDTHVHTSYSLDAFIMGNRTLGPDEAYRFARGEAVDAGDGRLAKLDRPLDFLAVTDHSDLIGLMPDLMSGQSELAATQTGARWIELMKTDPAGAFGKILRQMQGGGSAVDDIKRNEPLKRSMWRRITRIADDNNRPGTFTALIGYEWTSTPGGNNLHRNLIFRDDAATVGRVLPFSTFDSVDPKDLWTYMAAYEQTTGGQVLAIPHNSNLSNGLMFAVDAKATVNTRFANALVRMRWEPLVEVTQMKGDSETHPLLSPDDEFADYERWDKSNLFGNKPKEDWMLKTEYVRSALRIGLEQQRETGANPFKFGLVGGTDSHTGLSTSDDSNFWGKMASGAPRPGRWKQPMADDMAAQTVFVPYNWQTGASGYAAVWATENTRAAIFDAMKRKETYASTGPRIAVRFFGGWGFEAADAQRPDIAGTGYRKGVPMGGDLAAPPPGRSPSFLVWAAKDPDGANLDRAQVVKGWVDKEGKSWERVYNVALSGGRIDNGRRKVAKVGNTVDLRHATYRNSIGSTQLAAVWRDPDFDPQQAAFYYVRVIQIPTPRWTAYDAVRFGDHMADEVPMVVQERAYTSPIWYEPLAR